MAAPHPTDPISAKAAMRQRARAIRATLDPALGAQLAEHILRSDVLPAAIAGFWPMPGEIDVRPLWAALHARGHPVLLPETPPRGQALIFRLWHPDAVMLPERFGTQRPDGPEAAPDLIIVPFLAFDGAGHRLGYGGGYYDRTLAAHPGIPAIGAGFAALRVDRLPVEPHDRPLDAIFTEEGLVKSWGNEACAGRRMRRLFPHKPPDPRHESARGQNDAGVWGAARPPDFKTP